MSDHCERTPPVWLAASLLCRSAHGVYHSLPSFIPPWGECVTRKERERHGHSQEAWKKEGVSEDFCHDHFPIFLMPPSLASPVSGEGQWTSDVWRVLTAYFSLIIVTTVLSGPFTHTYVARYDRFLSFFIRLSHDRSFGEPMEWWRLDPQWNEEQKGTDRNERSRASLSRWERRRNVTEETMGMNRASRQELDQGPPAKAPLTSNSHTLTALLSWRSLPSLSHVER